MASQKPISTISYNTEAFLKEKLEDWLKAHIISAYQYICHKGEDGDKDHIHLRVEPNKRLDPMDLQEQLREYVSDNPKPLGCRPFRPSKEEDWFLYVLHDEQYLALKYGGGDKGEKIPYSAYDIIAPFDYDVDIAVTRAKASLRHTAPALVTEIRSGKNMLDLLSQGENVYLVNAVLNALQKTDYKNALREIEQKTKLLNEMQEAIDKAGFALDMDDRGSLCLVPKEKFDIGEHIKKRDKKDEM